MARIHQKPRRIKLFGRNGRKCGMHSTKKIFFTILTTLLAAGLLFAAGCKEETAQPEIDPAKLTSDVVANVEFASEMQELDKDSLAITYTIEEGVSVSAYIAGGALSDEIVVFTAPEENAAKKMLENAKAHIAERIELFADYAPAEVAKLEKAYTIQKGKYVVVCITDDIDNAKTVIDRYF